MKEKIGGFGDDLTKLTDGLNKSVNGLEKISSGLMGAGDYLDELKMHQIKTWPAGLFQKTS